MNSTEYENRTTPLVVTCTISNPGYFIQLFVLALSLFVLLPIQIWVLWLGIRNVRIKGRLAASEILTMNLSALEVLVIILYFLKNVACHFNDQNTNFLVTFVSGCYLVGRPFMNCLICVERYIAVAHPVIYRSPAFVKHRYVGAGLVWLASVVYGGLAVFSYAHPAFDFYILFLAISLLVMIACSLGVLKVLLKPSPGETQKEGMHRQKKRAFLIITVILVCLSVPYGTEIAQFVMNKYLASDAFDLLVGINFLIMQPSSVIQSMVYLSKRKKLPCTRKDS